MLIKLVLVRHSVIARTKQNPFNNKQNGEKHNLWMHINMKCMAERQ